MKKLLIITMLLLAFTSAYAKDPKETVEYWLNIPFDKQIVNTEMDKCWDGPMHQYFKVKEGSKQWNICVALVAAYGPRKSSFEEKDKHHRNLKKQYVN